MGQFTAHLVAHAVLSEDKEIHGADAVKAAMPPPATQGYMHPTEGWTWSTWPD
jgi:hypothetical protein